MSESLLDLDVERLGATARGIRRALDAEAVEILARTSRARVVSFELDRSGHLCIESQGSQEAGHTVRFAGEERWGAWSATGSPASPEHEPTTATGRLSFPDPGRVRALRGDSAHTEGSTRARILERPLLGESDARRWIDRLVDTAASALGDRGDRAPAFHLHGRLEDGAAESLLVNTHGVVAAQRSRVTGVRLEISLGSRSATVYMAANDDLHSGSTAALRRLVTELVLRGSAEPLGSPEPAAVLLRPAVLAPLLAHLAGRCWSPAGPGSIEPPEESTGLTLWDRPDLASGFLGGERDGEGLYARPCLLADHRGVRPVVPWERAGEGELPAPVGFRWRASWRDLPRFGPSHLVLQAGPAMDGDPVTATSHGFEVVAIRGGVGSQAGDLSFDALGYRVRGGERTQPLHVRLRIPEAGLLSSITGCGGASETHTLAAGSVTCPSARLEGLRLAPPRARGQEPAATSAVSSATR